MFPLIHIIMLELLSHRNGRRLRFTQYWNQEMNFHNNVSSHCSRKARFFFQQITLKFCHATAQTNMGNLNGHESCLRKAHWRKHSTISTANNSLPCSFQNLSLLFSYFSFIENRFFSYTILWLHFLRQSSSEILPSSPPIRIHTICISP